MKLPQKVAFLQLLKKYIERIKEGSLDTNELSIIPEEQPRT